MISLYCYANNTYTQQGCYYGDIGVTFGIVLSIITLFFFVILIFNRNKQKHLAQKEPPK